MIVVAAIGAKALYFLIVWLGSAAIAGALASRKGYEDRVGLATGLVLPVLGPIIWLLYPAKSTSAWKVEGPLRPRTRD